MSVKIILSVKLNSRCFIRDGVTIILTEVTPKLYCVEEMNITCNIQYLRVNSLVHITFSETFRDLFRWFKSSDVDLKDNERPGQPKKFEDEDFEASRWRTRSRSLSDS